jgi:hypothetical protein
MLRSLTLYSLVGRCQPFHGTCRHHLHDRRGNRICGCGAQQPCEISANMHITIMIFSSACDSQQYALLSPTFQWTKLLPSSGANAHVLVASPKMERRWTFTGPQTLHSRIYHPLWFFIVRKGRRVQELKTEFALKLFEDELGRFRYLVPTAEKFMGNRHLLCGQNMMDGLQREECTQVSGSEWYLNLRGVYRRVIASIFMLWDVPMPIRYRWCRNVPLIWVACRLQGLSVYRLLAENWLV